MSNKIMEVQDISKNVTTIKEKDLNRNWGFITNRINAIHSIIAFVRTRWIVNWNN